MGDNYWTDWKQNQRLEEAEEQLAAERRARNRLADQMRTQQGNITAQLDRLTRAFVALVEHEDIRAELGQYADAAACRRYAREVVSTVVATGGAALRGSVEPADVPGYWLAPAARGVAALSQDGAGSTHGTELLTEAAVRDPARTALFLTLLGALTRDPRWSRGHVTRTLPASLDLTTTQRQIWLAALEDRLGPEAVEDLVAALSAQVAAAGGAVLDEVSAFVEGQARHESQDVAAERAANQLEALHRVLSTGATTATATPGDALARSLYGAAPDGTEAAIPAEEDFSEDPLADCIRSLVDEGSPGEADILDRMATVRADLGFIDERAAAAPPAWSGPAGDVVSLLLADLAEPVGSARHVTARRVLGPALQTIGDELAQQAAVPVVDQRPVEVVGEVVTVGPDGATAQDWRQRIPAAVLRRNPENKALLPAAAGAGILALVSAGLGFVAGGFFVLAVLAACVAGGLLLAATTKRRDLRKLQEDTVTGTERSIARTSAAIKDEQARSAVAATKAAELQRAVRDGLGARV